MAWHCLTHTTRQLPASVEESTTARRLQRVWTLVELIRRGSTMAIRPMICTRDKLRTAESALKQLHTSGWWQAATSCDGTRRCGAAGGSEPFIAYPYGTTLGSSKSWEAREDSA